VCQVSGSNVWKVRRDESHDGLVSGVPPLARTMYRHHQAGVSILRTGRWPICYRRRGPSSGALNSASVDLGAPEVIGGPSEPPATSRLVCLTPK